MSNMNGYKTIMAGRGSKVLLGWWYNCDTMSGQLTLNDVNDCFDDMTSSHIAFWWLLLLITKFSSHCIWANFVVTPFDLLKLDFWIEAIFKINLKKFRVSAWRLISWCMPWSLSFHIELILTHYHHLHSRPSVHHAYFHFRIACYQLQKSSITQWE